MPEQQSPESNLESETCSATLQKGIALCLSGGGFRAMLFHLGALLRINEAALLPKISRVSSVSGGSITAAVLGLHWKRLVFENGAATNFTEEIVVPIRALASMTIDVKSILFGIVLPGSIADRVVKAYDKHLFKGATLQDLPSDAEGPRFVINATNVQSGVLWRFSRPYMGDYLVGRVMSPRISLAVAVAASSACPPVLSPLEIDLKPSDFTPDPGCPLQREPFTSKVVLSDGGVYDNLGLETAWKRYRTILVSDGGGALTPEENPKHDWFRHSYRVITVIDNQVRSLRKRQLIESYKRPDDGHDGAYWGIRSHIEHYCLPDALPCPEDQTLELAETSTRLERLDARTQERLLNWGYAVCDAALRRHFDPSIAKPKGFPYSGGVGK